MPMVVCPSLDSGIKTRYQLSCGQRLRVPNNSPDTLQEHANALSRGLNEQLSISILAHILSEEIKAILYMCDDRFIGREFKSSFAQKQLDEWLDLPLQQFFGSAGDNEV